MSIAACLLMTWLAGSVASNGQPQTTPTVPVPHVLGVAQEETLAILGATDRWDLIIGPDTLFAFARDQAETLAAAVETWRSHQCPQSRWRTWMVALMVTMAYLAGKL